MKPELSMAEVMKKHFGEVYGEMERYRVFHYIYRWNNSEKLRDYLNWKQKGLCARCGKKLDKSHLHHTNYDRQCRIQNPNCEYCFEKHNDEFIKCANCLVLICPECHEEIHERKLGGNNNEQ